MKTQKGFKLTALLLVFCMCFLLLTSCSGGKKPLTIWVGIESVDFYAEMMDEYVEMYLQKTGKAFPHEISVQGVDTASAAAKVLDDLDAGADIFTVAHDNLGKLTAGASAIAPVKSQALLSQIKGDNPQTFLDVINMTVQGTEYTFGIPYIGQSLVLMYNSKYLSVEDVKTWEGIWEVAKKNNMQSMSLMGDDGYNNSFLVLASSAKTGLMPAKIYEGGKLDKCDFTSDEVISIMQWGQRFFTDPNGGKMPTDSGWEIELRDEISLSLIGGAWKYKAAQAALGENLKIAILPSFTLTQEDVKGTSVEPNSVYRSGTFADCKVFVMKKGSEKAEYLEDILLYLSSKEIQEKSFIECANLPAYKNAITEFASMQSDNLDTALAARQLEMFNYGIPQPFGYSTTHNFYYYSKGGPDLVKEILENRDNLFTSAEAIENQLKMIENIWKTGERSN